MIATAVLVGLAAAGFAAIVKVLPWSPNWKKRKPLACPACMAGHSAWIMYVAALLNHQAPWPGLAVAVMVWLGATGVAVGILGLSGLFLTLGDD